MNPIRDLGWDRVSLLHRRRIDVERFEEAELLGLHFC
jgi:hypothetical protein